MPFDAHFPDEGTETHMYDAFCLWSQGEQMMQWAGPSAESAAALTNPHLGISPLSVTLAKGTVSKQDDPAILQTAFLTHLPQGQDTICL